MSPRMHRTIVALLLGSLAQLARAHDFWLQPAEFRIAVPAVSISPLLVASMSP